MGERDWGAQADFYEGFTSYHKIIIEFLEKTIKKDSLENKKVLDLGCGDGWVSGFINKKYGANILGTDISEELIKKASELHGNKNVSFRVSDAVKVAKLKDKFDFVFIGTVLCNISSKDKILKILNSTNRVLKSNGKVFILNPHPCFEDKSVKGFRERSFNFSFNYFSGAQEYKIKLFKKDGSFLTAKNYHYSLSEYFEIFSKAGFVVKSLLEFNFKENKNKEFSDYIGFVLEKNN